MDRAHRLRIHARVAVFGIVAAQTVTGAALAGVLAAGGDSRAAYSALIGTLGGVVPNFYLALRIFSVSPEASADRLLRAIYVGETIKIVFAAAVLAAAISFLDVSVWYVLGGYLATVLVYWLALLMPLPGEAH